MLTITIYCDKLFNVKRLTNTKKYFKKTYNKVLTFTIYCDIVDTTKQQR